MDPIIKSLLDKEPFRPLIALFNGPLRGFSSEQLLSVDHDIIVGVTKSGKLRAMLSIFLKDLEKERAIKEQCLLVELQDKVQKERNTWCLNLRGRVWSSIMKGQSVLSGNRRWSIRDLSDALTLAEQDEKKLQQEPAYLIIDLSENSLLDVDMELVHTFVISYVGHINESFKDTRFVVDLSYNRFHEDVCDKWLEELLKHEKIVYVNLCANPIVSIVRKDLFEKFFKKDERQWALKLIFIPYHWLISKGWHRLVSNSEKVLEAHELYYENYIYK